MSGARTAVVVLAAIAFAGSFVVGLGYSLMGFWVTSAPRSTEDVILLWVTRLAVLISVPLPLSALLTGRRVPVLSVVLSVVTLLLTLAFVALVPAMLFGFANP